jgi:hypothetical protein
MVGEVRCAVDGKGEGEMRVWSFVVLPELQDQVQFKGWMSATWSGVFIRRSADD